MPILSPPRRSRLDTLVALPDQLSTGLRWYQRTPPRLRRPEPAARVGLAAASVWFALLFLALGVVAARAGRSAPWYAPVGYDLAAACGAVALAAAGTRRLRASAAWLGSMLVLGQAVTLLALR